MTNGGTPSLRLLAALAAALVTGALTVAIVTTNDDDGSGHHHRTVVVRIDGRDAGHRPDAGDPVMRVPAAAVKAAAASELGDHVDLRDESPVGVAPQDVAAGLRQQDELAQSDQLPPVAPDAAPSQPGCRSRFTGNYSSRRGVAPRLVVWHLTVSPNIPGWGDVDGVTAFLSRPATAASANYVEDREGHCNYIVREVDKAWHVAGFNSVAVGIEVVNTGREGSYTSGAGQARLLALTRDIAARWNIPLRRGAVTGCSVLSPGIVTHQQLGVCGGGHVDVSPYDNINGGRSQEVSRLIAALPTRPVTRTDRVTCRKLNWWRDHGRPHGAPERNAVRRRAALARRDVICTVRGPVRA